MTLCKHYKKCESKKKRKDSYLCNGFSYACSLFHYKGKLSKKEKKEGF